MGLSDEEWLATARNRLANGESWERPLGSTAPLWATPPQPPPSALRCPYCAEHPALEIFRRYEVLSADPLLNCPRCYGFWAKGDSISRGVADPHSEHPALRAVPFPPRCRACAGRLDQDERCRACGVTLPMLNCPECGKEMVRAKDRGVTIDSCMPCKGVWFDTGEVSLAFGIEPPQGMAMSTIDEHATDDQPPEWVQAAAILTRMFAPFL